MNRALAFYTGVLPFEVVAETEVAGPAYEHLFGVFVMRAWIVRLRLGAEEIELIDYLAPEGRPVPVDSRSNDEWFQHVAIIVRDMDAAYAHLRRHKVQHASSGPQVLPDWNPNAAGIAAFYFRDPDGNHLEILQFPPDKGDPRWQQPGDSLVLGIDHTEIVVRDTDARLPFFQGALDLRVRGT
jgi:catechol 2,3-dioxygenase-like lactoylglutathione lyase family enzyme